MNIPPVATVATYQRLRAINSDRAPGAHLALRVAVLGGGCSGFNYELNLVEGGLDDDIILTDGDGRVLIDVVSMPFLSGARIDFEDGLAAQKFVIENPNAVSSCGCGTSFSI